jgi:hypothetical protein
MYEPHPEFETPPDTSKVWRYIDLAPFLYLLHSRTLYFCRVTELDDPWEAALSANLAAILDGFGARANAMKNTITEAAASSLVNCWHENDDESVAMWKLYTSGKDGVAICTNIGRFKKALETDPYPIIIGRVEYTDYTAVPPSGPSLRGRINALLPAFQKRRSYRHEREVRAVIAFPEVASKQIGVPYDPSHGIAVGVNLETLIERLVVSPRYPMWAIESLQQRVLAAGVTVSLEKSDLLRMPEPRTMTPIS